MAKPIKRLVADLRKGVLSEAEAANLAFGMVQGSSEVPLRYRLGKVTEYDLMVLGVATGADATTAIGDSGRSSRSGVPCPDGIPPGMNVHVCHYDSSHTSITYFLENIDGAPADPDVVPYYVTRWAEVADAAWEYYHSVLDMTPTGDTISVYLGLEAAGKVCGSWPTAQILCGSAIEAFQVDYFAAHEMFHQFQWHYVNRAIFSLYELNPWMESTADWASAHFATTMPRPYGSWTGEAARIKAFFQ